MKLKDKKIIKICKQCGMKFECNSTKREINRKFCSSKCSHINWGKIGKSFKTHSEKTKNKISESRKKYLEENKHKHNWSLYKNEQTYPEKLFEMEIRKVKYKVYSYYIPKESKKMFEIDFAIPFKKIGYEINGNQHYNKNKELKNYYKNRHNYLKLLGWKIIEIPYLLCYDKNKITNIIKKSLNTELDDEDNKVINYKEYIKLNKKLKRNREEYFKEKKKNYVKSQEKNINSVINSGIDFNKFGWVGKVSKLIDQSPQRVNKWMKRFLPEFYEKECYKRKLPT